MWKTNICIDERKWAFIGGNGGEDSTHACCNDYDDPVNNIRKDENNRYPSRVPTRS